MTERKRVPKPKRAPTPPPPAERIARSLEWIATSLDRIANQYAPVPAKEAAASRVPYDVLGN